MADFQTHLKGGAGCAIIITAAAFWANLLAPLEALLVFGCGLVGALLPDLDSPSGRPRLWLSRLLGIGIPFGTWYLITAARDHNFLYTAVYLVCGYFLISTLVRVLLSSYTIHRGALHSLAFAVLGAQIAYILFSLMAPAAVAGLAALAAGSGVLAHLLLDEIHSTRLKFGVLPVFKSSRGSALKLAGPHPLANLGLLVLLAITSSMCYFLYTEGSLEGMARAAGDLYVVLTAWFST